MEKEAKFLSKFVKKQLSEYNMQILESFAILIDPCDYIGWFLCLLVVEGIELFGCGEGSIVFCFITALVFSIKIGGWSALYALICSLYFNHLCKFPDKETREWYCGWQFQCP